MQTAVRAQHHLQLCDAISSKCHCFATHDLFGVCVDAGNTNTQGGLERALELLQMAPRSNGGVEEVVLVLTDGKPSGSPYNTNLDGVVSTRATCTSNPDAY